MVQVASEPRVPAEAGRHRLLGLERQRRIEAPRSEPDRLGHRPAEWPGRSETDREDETIVGLRSDLPRPLEHRPVDGVRGQVAGESDLATTKREAAIADPPGEWRHRVAAPADGTPALGDEHLVLADAQGGHPATLARVDGEPDVARAQHDATRGAVRHQRATVIARSGRRTKGGRNAGMLENGSTSGCRSMPSTSVMNRRRAWIRDHASGKPAAKASRSPASARAMPSSMFVVK